MTPEQTALTIKALRTAAKSWRITVQSAAWDARHSRKAQATLTALTADAVAAEALALELENAQ